MITTYKEPFGKAWNKLLKNELFPNVLNNAQNIRIEFANGSGWDWIYPNNDIMAIGINESEIVQCNFDDSNFICYVNFGSGYKFLHIPFSSIVNIYIGGFGTNWIRNPIPPIHYNLTETEIMYLSGLEENKENKDIEDDSMETVN